MIVLLLAVTGLTREAASAVDLPQGAAFLLPGPFQGSVPRGRKGTGRLPLSLGRALELGLANNLGVLTRREGVASAEARRFVELSRLLPNITTGASIHRQRESFAITGINLPGAPTVIGPFTYYDARVFLSQRLFDLQAIRRNESAANEVSAAEWSLRDAREMIVVAVGAAYLEALAGAARVDTIRTQVATAQTLVNRASELHKAGISPGIDELRAKVELLTRSQQLIVAENDEIKQKLTIARLIGLPVDQEVELATEAPYREIAAIDPYEGLAQALRCRKDFRAAQHLLKAAEGARQAAGAERVPSLVLDADYGSTGLNLSSMQETYHIVGSLRFQIFEGGKIHGDVLQAEAFVRQRQDELDNLRGQIEYEVRTALLDVEAAAKQVAVARTSVDLAETTLSQADERFMAGVSDNLEVVQAQQSVATAHEALISSLYLHNLAKLLLARALGIAEESAPSFSGGW